MFKKSLLSLLLLSAIFSTSAMANTPPACVIDQDNQQDWSLQVNNCKFSKENLAEVNEYFSSHLGASGLIFVRVKINAETSNALMDLIANNNKINLLLFWDSKIDNTALAKLAKNSWIHVLALGNTGIDKNTLMKISENNSISTLIVDEKTISANTVGEFLDKHPLTYLSLARIDNNGLKELVKHPNFSGLGLPETIATDFTTLRSLPQLNQLLLTNTTINHESALAIGELKNLTYLVISDVTLAANDTNLMLANLDELAYLDISHYDPALTNANVDDETTMVINRLTHLKQLNLANQNISNTGAFVLSMNSHLEELGLSGNHIQDEGGYSLANNQSITFLDISDNQLSDPTAYAFAQNTTLKNLFIRGNHFSYAAIDALKMNTHLEYLSIDDDRDDNRKVKVESLGRDVDYVIKKFMKVIR